MGINVNRMNQINAAHRQMFSDARDQLHALQPSLMVIGNGLSQYGYPPDHGMATLAALDGVCVEHFGAFEGVIDATGKLNATMMSIWLDLITQSAAMNKTVIVKAWVGPETTPIDGYGPTWPTVIQPPLNRTGDGVAKAAAELLAFPLAAFLCVIEPNVLLSYAWWYDLAQGYVPCTPGVEPCDCPAEFYPEFSNYLGPPLGPPRRQGLQCTREFAGAKIFVDLADETSASIIWK